MKLPSVDSPEFKALPYKEKLQVLSLKFFNEDEYRSQTGVTVAPDASILKNLPPSQTITVHDLPASFLRGHWAGYNCYFKEEWYAGEYRGLSPLDDFGLESRRVVNIRAFNFPFLALDDPLYYIFLWMSNFDSQTAWKAPALLRACKTYLYLDLVLKQLGERGFRSTCGASSIVKESLERFRREWHFLLLNCYCPIVEECDELGYFEDGAFLLFSQARRRQGRWFLPLMPSGLFSAPKFHIKNWDWLS